MYKRTKLACYTINLCMAVVMCVPPLFFVTFRDMYGISYSLLGLLVLVNFCTQLSVDLIFSFFSHKFNISKTVKSIPVITMLGMLIFASAPLLFRGCEYFGLILGTIVFSASAGLMEVLTSPVIAAIPSENPERDMSKLHSIYAWGVVAVVLITTVFLYFFDEKNWPIVMLLFTLFPIFSTILFLGAEIPEIQTSEKSSGTLPYLKNRGLWLCIFAIFLGGAAECTMSSWCSGYLETSLGIPKMLGDVFGVALFGLMLGLGRSLYAKCGRNIERVLLFCAIGSFICYILTVVSPFPALAIAAAALTGLCTSMLWPGTLIVATEKFPAKGVFIYALMASGGDLGASVVPELVGIVTDVVSSSRLANELSEQFSLTTEQIGMKAGMLVASLFPLIAIFIYSHFIKEKRKNKNESEFT